MKTKKDYQKAIDEIKEVCKKYSVALLGTCESEGIYGEITIFDTTNKKSLGWADPGELNNKLYFDGDYYSLSAIGDRRKRKR